jgi:hypothetical protein
VDGLIRRAMLGRSAPVFGRPTSMLIESIRIEGSSPAAAVKTLKVVGPWQRAVPVRSG